MRNAKKFNKSKIIQSKRKVVHENAVKRNVSSGKEAASGIISIMSNDVNQIKDSVKIIPNVERSNRLMVFLEFYIS